MTLNFLLKKIIEGNLRKRGYSNYAIESITEPIIQGIVNYKEVPLRQRVFALRHGFFVEKIHFYRLDEQNYQNYLSDLDYFWLHPLNGIYSHWIDDKLSIRYLLAPFSEFLPKYYYHVSIRGVIRLQDCPDELSANEYGIIELLKKKVVLAAKPVIGTAGAGFIKLSYESPNLLMNDLPVSEQVLIRLFGQWRLSESGYIITEYLHTHPVFSRIWSKTANALRITVLRGSDNQAKIAYAFTRFGNTTSGVVENSVAGGIFNFINLKTGEFSQGKIWRDDRIVDCAVHPETGEVVSGIVPYWGSIVQKLLEICDFLPQLRYVGFDVAVVENGFKIIEINSHPSHEFFQWFLPAYKSEVIGSFFKEKLRKKRNQIERSRRRHSMFFLIGKVINFQTLPKKWLTSLNKRAHDRAINEHMLLIKNSVYFNEQWYIENYPEVRNTDLEPARHYLLIGAFEAYDPGPDFSSSRYLARYDDVRKEGMNPLLHYLKYGKFEGREIF